MQKIHLTIEGMSCGHCVARVRRVLEETQGVRVTAVQVGSADAEIDPERIDPVTVAQAVSDAGYPASIAATRAA
jgi:copper chaperone CopZ